MYTRAQYQDDMDRVPVKWLFVSPKARLRIGTFAPLDPKPRRISALVGSIGLSAVGDYSSESDPRAYQCSMAQANARARSRASYCGNCGGVGSRTAYDTISGCKRPSLPNMPGPSVPRQQLLGLFGAPRPSGIERQVLGRFRLPIFEQWIDN
jgi:PrkA AAA domain